MSHFLKRKTASNVVAEVSNVCLQICGVQSDELGKVLRLLGLKKKRLVNLLPLLEFITWSLLKEDSTVRNRRVTQKKKDSASYHKSV